MYQSIQGNLGFGKAIEYFTSHNITVALPLNDTQKYDLIADFNGKLQKVQVKTSRYSRNGGVSYEVLLKNCGGTSKGSKIRPFDNTTCDYVFVVLGNDKMYLIECLHDELDRVEYALMLLDDGKADRVTQSKTTLLQYKDNVIKLLNEAKIAKIPEEKYGLFIKYPKGYEG